MAKSRDRQFGLKGFLWTVLSWLWPWPVLLHVLLILLVAICLCLAVHPNAYKCVQIITFTIIICNLEFQLGETLKKAILLLTNAAVYVANLDRNFQVTPKSVYAVVIFL